MKSLKNSINEALVKKHIPSDWKNSNYIPGKFNLSLEQCKKINGLYAGSKGIYFIIENHTIKEYDNWNNHTELGYIVEKFENDKITLNEAISKIQKLLKTNNDNKLINTSDDDIDILEDMTNNGTKWAYICELKDLIC